MVLSHDNSQNAFATAEKVKLVWNRFSALTGALSLDVPSVVPCLSDALGLVMFIKKSYTRALVVALWCKKRLINKILLV